MFICVREKRGAGETFLFVPLHLLTWALDLKAVPLLPVWQSSTRHPNPSRLQNAQPREQEEEVFALQREEAPEQLVASQQQKPLQVGD